MGKYARKTEDAWTKENMQEALAEIKECRLSVPEAAVKYKITKVTLYRRLKKFVDSGGQKGAGKRGQGAGNPVLTEVEEQRLEKTIVELRNEGYAVNRLKIRSLCFQFCASNNIPNQFHKEKRMASDDWYYGFLKRHPRLKVGIHDKSGEDPMETPEGRKKKKSSGSKKSGGSSSSCSAIGDSGGSRPHVEITAELPVAVAGTSDSGSSSAASSAAGGSVGTQVESSLKAPNLEMVDSDKCTQNLQCREILWKRKSRGRSGKDAKGNKKSRNSEDDGVGKTINGGVNGIIDEGVDDDESEDTDGFIDQFENSVGNPVLTKLEEYAIEDFVVKLLKMGHRVASWNIKRLCFELCDSNNSIPTEFNLEMRMASDEWYCGFLKRHPRVKMKEPGGGQKEKTAGCSRKSKSGEYGAGDSCPEQSAEFSAEGSPAALAESVCAGEEVPPQLEKAVLDLEKCDGLGKRKSSRRLKASGKRI